MQNRDFFSHACCLLDIHAESTSFFCWVTLVYAQVFLVKQCPAIENIALEHAIVKHRLLLPAFSYTRGLSAPLIAASLSMQLSTYSCFMCIDVNDHRWSCMEGCTTCSNHSHACPPLEAVQWSLTWRFTIEALLLYNSHVSTTQTSACMTCHHCCQHDNTGMCYL